LIESIGCDQRDPRGETGIRTAIWEERQAGRDDVARIGLLLLGPVGRWIEGVRREQGGVEPEVGDQEVARDRRSDRLVDPHAAGRRQLRQRGNEHAASGVGERVGGDIGAARDREVRRDRRERGPRLHRPRPNDRDRPDEPISQGRAAQGRRASVDRDLVAADGELRERDRDVAEGGPDDPHRGKAKGRRSHGEGDRVARMERRAVGPQPDDRPVRGQVLVGDRRVDEERLPDREHQLALAGAQRGGHRAGADVPRGEVVGEPEGDAGHSVGVGLQLPEEERVAEVVPRLGAATATRRRPALSLGSPDRQLVGRGEPDDAALDSVKVVSSWAPAESARSARRSATAANGATWSADQAESGGIVGPWLAAGAVEGAVPVAPGAVEGAVPVAPGAVEGAVPVAPGAVEGLADGPPRPPVATTPTTTAALTMRTAIVAAAPRRRSMELPGRSVEPVIACPHPLRAPTWVAARRGRAVGPGMRRAGARHLTPGTAPLTHRVGTRREFPSERSVDSRLPWTEPAPPRGTLAQSEPHYER